LARGAETRRYIHDFIRLSEETALYQVVKVERGPETTRGSAGGIRVWIGPLVPRMLPTDRDLIVSTPLPAALPLFATGLGALGLLGSA
jgi:hypothetical protein